jgi:hypothetical protein
MSQAVMEAPAFIPLITESPVLLATEDEVAAFRELHEADVDECINTMLKRIQVNIRYPQVITPRYALVRTNNSAPVHEDFDAPGCKNSIMMRNFFRKKCPEGIQVTFSYKLTTIYVGGERVQLVLLDVRFFMSLVKWSKTRTSKES